MAAGRVTAKAFADGERFTSAGAWIACVGPVPVGTVSMDRGAAALATAADSEFRELGCGTKVCVRLA